MTTMKTAGLVLLVLMLICAVYGADNSPIGDKPASGCDVSLAMAVGALTEKMTQVEKELTELKSITSGIPKVAFSAALYESGSGDTGPFNIDTPLKYKNVFSNFGSNYNPATGIFTASSKGMYFFHFTMKANHSPNSVVSLFKNGVRVVSVWDVAKSDDNDMASNVAVLPLEVGDTVYVQLYANRLVYDDIMNYNTFSGFMLFTI